MLFFQQPRDPAEWERMQRQELERLQALGSEITSVGELQKRLFDGQNRVRAIFDKIRDKEQQSSRPMGSRLTLSPDLLREIHAELYKDIYPGAGKFRTGGDFQRDEMITKLGLEGSHHEDISSDIQSIAEVGKRTRDHDVASERVTGAVYEHVAVLRVIPFEEGSGRVARLLLNENLDRIYLGPESCPALDPRAYYDSLQASLENHRTVDLKELITGDNEREVEKQLLRIEPTPVVQLIEAQHHKAQSLSRDETQHVRDQQQRSLERGLW